MRVLGDWDERLLGFSKNVLKTCVWTKVGGLDLSRRRQRVSLDSRENLNSVKKLVSTIEISRSRSRLLDFVSTTMSRPKSLNRDREIRRDLKFLAFLDSLSQSQPRSAWIFVFSRRDFSIRRDLRPRQCRDFSTNLNCVSTNLDCVSTNLKNLDASQQILTILTRLDNLDKNLDASKSRLKREKKSWSQPSRKSRQFKKVSLDTKDILDLDLDWSRLSRPPTLVWTSALSEPNIKIHSGEKIRMHGYGYNGTIRVTSPSIGLDENNSFCMRRGHFTINTHIVGFTSSFLWIGENLSYSERIQWNKKMLKMLISACADYSINVRKASQISMLFKPFYDRTALQTFKNGTPLPTFTIFKWLSFFC